MSIREDFEQREKSFMSGFACLSCESKARLKKEEPCEIRTEFQVDRDRIVYSNAFRRLKYKTQVFLSPLGDHYRTRLTHTLEVAQIARTIARTMRFNEDLTEAVALGHDIGHPPFGHSGEAALKEIYSPDFSHNEQSLRVIDILENNGKGLNLTYEVRDGILKHSKGYGKIISDNPKEMACTYEGRIVRIADIMAYLNHDLDDAIRSGVITVDQVPEKCTKILGNSHSERATTMMWDLIFSSEKKDHEINFKMSDKVYSAMKLLRQFLYNNVYRSSQVHQEFMKAKKVICDLYTYFLNNPKMLEQEMISEEMSACYNENLPIEQIACDLIASMTDRYALDCYTRIFFPCRLF